jgi:hypothetical protein
VAFASEEVIVPPPPHAVAPITQVRGTLVTASLQVLGELGHLERYWGHLDVATKEQMKSVIASSWVPETLARAHYHACEALNLSPSEIATIGGNVGARIQATFLGALLRVAREAGTTPWLYFTRLPRLYGRICIGGAVAIYKIAPKEARAEWYGVPGLAIPYFRRSFRAANQSIIELFCRKAYVSEAPATAGGDWAFRASWV